MGESHMLWTETEEGQMLDSEGMTAGPSLPDQRSTRCALHNLVSGFNITVMDQIVAHASSFHQRAWLGIQDVADTVGTH